MSNYLQELYKRVEQTSKTDKEFVGKLSHLSEGTQLNVLSGVQHFKVYADLKGTSSSDLIEGLQKVDRETRPDMIYELLNDIVEYFINEKPCIRCYFESDKTYIEKCVICHGSQRYKGMYASSVPIYLGYVKKYLRFFGLLDGITDSDIKANVHFKAPDEEEAEPVTKQMLKAILENQKDSRRRLFWHTISQTGFRMAEGLNLTPADFEPVDQDDQRVQDGMPYHRVRINIRSDTTKKRKQRKTYLSKEVERDVMKLISSLPRDKKVFTDSDDVTKAKNNENSVFDYLRGKLVKDFPILAEKRLSGTHKITIYSLRSYFVTHANRVDYGLGHAFAGHRQYMNQYDRITPTQKMELLKKCDESLQVYGHIQDDSSITSKTMQHDFMDIVGKQNDMIEDLKKELALLKQDKTTLA